MSISNAIHDIEVSESAPPSRLTVFRSTQRALDLMIDEVEHEVMAGSAALPGRLVRRAAALIASVHGRFPTWLNGDVTPASLLDHLLVAEGRLRQRYYKAVRLDLDESA